MDVRDEGEGAWPLRPWIMAGLCAAAGLLFDALTDYPRYGLPQPAKAALATLVAVAALSFVLTVERQRWWWSAAFALGWGGVIALVGWFTAGYNNKPTIFEWPFFSGLFAVLLAAPLFQTIRDEGAWRFPYPRLHRHVWVDAVIGGSSLVFTGISFLLAWLIAGLFRLIGIRLFTDLLQESAFAWALAGFAFGAAVGLLRERDGLATILYRLVTIVLSVLAPVLAGALLLFLLSLPFTGLHNLWNSSVPATPMLLLAGAAAFALTNAVIGDGTVEKRPSRILHWSALILSQTILPLAIVAALSIGQRIGQYGWTPERIWGVLAVLVALAYGAAGWWSAIRRRAEFDVALRPLQTALAIGVCGLALFLALPILDFGAISANSQIAGLRSGKVAADKFDWQAMAFQFGPAGRRRLAHMARSGPVEHRRMAAAALKSKERYDVTEAVEAAANAPNVEAKLRVLPEGTAVPPPLRDVAARSRFCRVADCALVFVNQDRAVLVGRTDKNSPIQSLRLSTRKSGDWSEYDNWSQPEITPERSMELTDTNVEVRNVSRRQIFVDGQPVGEVFE
ncbi:MAG: DUF4153 domain-containing protein [Sphingomicrobium sp.]